MNCTKLTLFAAAFAAQIVYAGPTLDYAKSEAERLLGRVGLKPEVIATEGKGGVPYALAITLGTSAPLKPSATDDVKWDGYALRAGEGAWTISALSEKGVLNGLYGLAMRWGFSFVFPTQEGELVPAKIKDIGEGEVTENPRFRYRGLFASSKELGYTNEDWNKFLAKLRFNAICSHADTSKAKGGDWLKILGFRTEAGGHGMSSCLPRELYAHEPELFRMFQPEDFGGKRLKDSNFCISNPKTRAIVKENFKKKLLEASKSGTYALHAWADDLPGGGWCMCSRCRPMQNTDQSQLTMNVEAQAVRELKLPMRVPAIAYHDTMFPSDLIKPDPLCFYLFAPRERCYAHALNDQDCARNRIFHSALKAYSERYKGIDDAHTFEYYNDKLLFRGHTPFLPAVIIGDADAYEEAGVECWMSLQVGGDLLGVDFNMLAHSLVAWDGYDEATLVRRIATQLSPEAPERWSDYLEQRAEAYQTAWRICDLPYEVYLDYRWLPERGGQSGADLVANISAGAGILHKALDEFRRSTAGVKGQGASLVARELKRCAFEATDLDALALQQRGLNAICESWNGGGQASVDCAVANLKAARAKLDEAKKLCEATFTEAHRGQGMFTGQYYPGFVKNWTGPEIDNKIRIYGWKAGAAFFTSAKEEGGVYEATFVGGDAVRDAEFCWQVEIGRGADTKREWRTRKIEGFAPASGKVQTYVPTDSFVYYVKLILKDGTTAKSEDRMPKARLAAIGKCLEKAKKVTEPRAFTNATKQVLKYRWHQPATLEAGKKYPLVVFLHGAGERGTENVRQMIHGVPQILDYSERTKQPCFLVAGQVSNAPHPTDPAGCKWVQVPWDGKTQPMPKEPSAAMAPLLDLLAQLRQNPAVDASRIYVTGLSMGGYGTWDLVMRRPDWFAAAMPLCGGADDSKVALVKDLPIWVFHGANDTCVLPERATNAVKALKAAGGTKVKLTMYPGIGHDCWTPTYASDDILNWLFSQHR